jgi:Ca2+-binding EF-hand superfamily protein
MPSLKEIFQNVDVNRDGKISEIELEEYLKQLQLDVGDLFSPS